MAILGSYMLRKAARKKSDFLLRGEPALELAYNLYEAGVITAKNWRRSKRWREGAWRGTSIGRLALMELGAEFVKPEDSKNRKARRKGNEQE
ncbi:MAG: hypothetical protein JZD41_02900 [Thermoproteus sp.]|nr:hypothetical protein [Thermoproteus sp.]